MNLRHLTDEQLVKDTEYWVKRERECTTTVLYHLKEVERRRVFSDLGYGSLFEYAVKGLGYSEGAAVRRMHSARLLAELPELEEKISSGVLSLSNLSSAVNLFKKENIRAPEKKKEVLRAIEKKTSRECDKVLDLFSQIERERLFTVSFKVPEKTLGRFNELKGHLAPRTLSDENLLELMVSNTLDKVVDKKFKRNATPAPESLSAKKKEVYERDQGKCSKCGSMFRLEYDHREAQALGGATSKENLRLLCFSCNQRARISARL